MSEAHDSTLERAVAALFKEIIHGSGPTVAWLLNPNDAGLLASLDRLDARQASQAGAAGSASVAAHAEHLRFGLSLLNRYEEGSNPFENADWAAAWRRGSVTEEEWAELRQALRREAERWEDRFSMALRGGELALTGVLAQIGHLAYHLGAIRQIQPSARGPKAEG